MPTWPNLKEKPLFAVVACRMVVVTMKAITLALLMLLTGASQSLQAAKPEKLTPLRVNLEALQSPEGLQLERKSVREETVEVDGREVELRHYVFRFFRQRFPGRRIQGAD